jgi:2-dehydro-3-deoxyphosphogluconate aldolase / (4S)-4-hydroxy-2-oxoglutarate aldolase
MSKTQDIQQAIVEQAMLPLFFHPDEETSLAVMHALYRAGIRAIEYTNRGSQALDNFMAMRKEANAKLPGMLLGIGTIKTWSEAEQFAAAGADFIISPIVEATVAEAAKRAGKPWIPGCMTPTEIQAAAVHGATLIKLFPGNLLGPTFVSSIKELFPGILFMPTGGVEVDQTNLSTWFKSGVAAVGMGSKLITKEIFASKDYSLLERNVATALALVKSCRQ